MFCSELKRSLQLALARIFHGVRERAADCSRNLQVALSGWPGGHGLNLKVAATALRICEIFALAALPFFSAVFVSAADFKSGDYEFFEKKIRPVLVERCYKCHSARSGKVKGDLRLDSREGMLKGGESGKPSVIPGDANKSLLIESIRYTNDDLKMPPAKEGKLSDEQIADFIAWVKMGAPYPGTEKSEIGNRKSEIEVWWSFQPIKNPHPPPVKGRGWIKSPV